MAAPESEAQPADLTQVAVRLAAIEQTLQAFQKIAISLLELASRAPVHLDVEHLEVERLEFKVDSVDVGELSGELNIGLTSRFDLGHQPGAPDEGHKAPLADAACAPAPPPVKPIWPPADGSGGDAGDSFGPPSGTGAQRP